MSKKDMTFDTNNLSTNLCVCHVIKINIFHLCEGWHETEAPDPAERHSERSMAKAAKRVLLALRRKPWRSAVPVTLAAENCGVSQSQVPSKTPQDGEG